MSAALRLRVVVPDSVVLDEPIRSLVARDASGAFGIHPGHEAFHTCLVNGIITLQTADGAERFVAVRRGVLRVDDGVVDVATRDAVVADDLGALEQLVARRFRERDADERDSEQALYRLQLAAMRNMVGYGQART